MALKQILLNTYLQIAFVSWFIAQLLKVIITFIIFKKIDIKRMWGSGGFPSSHTSSVVALTTAIGIIDGFATNLFAISLVFSMVVMYDASGVRRAVGKQAKIINTMLLNISEKKSVDNKALKELIGHTPFEVIGGALLGIVVANIMIK